MSRGGLDAGGVGDRNAGDQPGATVVQRSRARGARAWFRAGMAGALRADRMTARETRAAQKQPCSRRWARASRIDLIVPTAICQLQRDQRAARLAILPGRRRRATDDRRSADALIDARKKLRAMKRPAAQALPNCGCVIGRARRSSRATKSRSGKTNSLCVLSGLCVDRRS